MKLVRISCTKMSLAGLNDAKNQVAQEKSTLTNEICEFITNCLEEENDSEIIFKLAPQILNNEGWIRTDDSGRTNLKFTDNSVTFLSEHFATPLQNAKTYFSSSSVIKSVA